jgi:polyhydroxyalkanoate synthesis regulator phasin
MNQDINQPEEMNNGEGKKQHTAFYEATRRILLASIGAAMLAQEEIEGFVNRLIERGEMAEIDARRLIHEVRERRDRMERKHQELKRKEGAQNPEIELLATRIAELTRQVEELKRQQTTLDTEEK